MACRDIEPGSQCLNTLSALIMVEGIKGCYRNIPPNPLKLSLFNPSENPIGIFNQEQTAPHKTKVFKIWETKNFFSRADEGKKFQAFISCH